jgi:hypothetical protein
LYIISIELYKNYIKKRSFLMKTFKTVTAIALLAMTATSFAADQKVASTTSPVSNPPQFIVIGSDDNTNAAALKWMADVISGGKNKNGSDRYMSFYVNTFANKESALNWETNTALREAAKHAYDLGHEVSNHTATHIRGVGGNGEWGKPGGGDDYSIRMSYEDILADMENARDKMVVAGIPVKHQFGFRTPFLAYSDSTFSAMKTMGFLYDCSINALGLPGEHNFPYTLDAIHNLPGWNPDGNIAPDGASWYGHGSGGSVINPIREHKGLWTIPASGVQVDEADRLKVFDEKRVAGYVAGVEKDDNGNWKGPAKSGDNWVGDWKVAGLDYNIWAEGVFLDSVETVRALMYTLRKHLNGNRAPFAYGVHSQYYVNSTGAYNGLTEKQMKGSFEEFVRQASQLENVFFVSGDMVIRWMQNPVSAAQFNPANYLRDGCAHNWVEQSKTDETCEAEGKIIYKCSECQSTKEETIAKQTSGCGVSGDVVELIGWEYTLWSSYKDNFGGTEIAINNENPLQATLKLGAQEGTNYPYLGLGVYLAEDAFLNFTTVEVNYTASGALKLGIGVLDAEGKLDDYGEPIEATYELTLPAGSNERTFTLSNFAKPGWTPTGFVGPANLSLADPQNLVPGVVFFHATYGATIEIEVTSLKVDGQNGGTSNITKPMNGKTAKSTTLAITGISAGKLGLTVPTAGNYTVALYSVDGKMIAQTKANLTRGANTLSIGRNLAKGVVVVRIQGMNTQLVKKIMVK